MNNVCYTINILIYSHNVTTTNMRYIHTSIVSRHLVTRSNNTILRTPPPHSSEEILPRLTRRTLAQPRTNKSPFLVRGLGRPTWHHPHRLMKLRFSDRYICGL